MIRAEVGPLREVRLAENHRTCLPQARDEERIGLRAVLGKRQGPRRVDEADDVDIVLQKHRDTVQRSTDLADGPLTVALGGLGQRGRERVQERRCMLGGELGEIARVLVEQPPCVYAPRNRWISSSHSAKPSRFFVVRSRSCIRRALRRETAFLAERRVLGSGSAG